MTLPEFMRAGGYVNFWMVQRYSIYARVYHQLFQSYFTPSFVSFKMLFLQVSPSLPYEKVAGCFLVIDAFLAVESSQTLSSHHIFCHSVYGS
jgi:hypothetical protein